MSTTIDSLDIQISTSSGNSAARIEAIAKALGNLKENGKITTATNGMKKLAEALDTLNPALDRMNPAKLQQLRGAMSGLSNIQKLSGLNSAVNTLKKIPDVVSGLEAVDLTRFKSQMDRLSDALAPLARHLDQISKGFAKLPNYVGKAVTATNRMTKATEQATVAAKENGATWDKQGINIMSAIHNFNAIMGAVQMVGDAIGATMAQAMEWDGIQYRFGRAFGEDAEDVLAYAEKINDVMGINIQQFMQYSSLYGSLLSGFGMAQEKVTTISVGLTELSYDIWAAYNDRFKSLEDASEAVRSAITGEIEPIRNAGIALTEASLQEYMNQVGMAQISIEKLSEAQKAEVRYAAMMNAAMQQGIVGTYASEMQTAEGAVRNLSQAFKGLVQAFGSLFIPILQAAIPYLTAFINLLYDAIAAIASFFGIAFFEIDWGNGAEGIGGEMERAAAGAGGVASGMGGAAKAAKKLRDYTMGFDELNVIQPPTETGGGGGGGAGGGVDWGNGLDLKTLWDESIFKKASQQVSELEQKIKDWFEEWKLQIAIVAGALGALSMSTMLGHFGEALGLSDKFLRSIQEIKKIATVAIILTVQYSLMSEFLENFIKEGEWESYLWAALVGALGAFGSYLVWGKKGLMLSLAITAVASFEATFADGNVDSLEEVTTGLTGLASAAGAAALAWPLLKPVFEGIVEFFRAAKQMAPEVGWLAALFPKLSGALAPVASSISSAAGAVASFIGGISAPVWGTIAAVVTAIGSAALFLARNWDEVVAAVKRFFDENIAPKIEEIGGHFERLGKILSPILDIVKWLLQPVVDLAKGFGEWWAATKPLNALMGLFETLGAIVVSVVGGVIMGAIEWLVSIVENAIQIITGVFEIFYGIADVIVAAFTGGDIEAAWKKIWQGIYDVVWGFVGLIISPIKDFVGGIIDWFVYLWDELVGHSIVPDMIDAIVEWFLSLPGKILKPVQDFANDVVKKFKDMWEKTRSWWHSNVAPKFTQSYWKQVFDNVVNGVYSKLSETKGKLTEVWNGVRSWFNSNVAPKLTLAYWKEKFNNIVKGIKDKWTEAKSWWDNNKPTLSTVHAVIASIKDKLSSAWTAAKNWWDDSRSALSSVSVAVGSIKSKLESAWSSAKKWWDDNVRLSIPTLSFKVEYTTKNLGSIQKAIVNALNLPGWPRLSFAKYGGVFDTGSLIWAGEAGAEIVANAGGGRTGVMNIEQMQEAVSQGVYSAVVAAMGGNAGQSEQVINIYLDGKQITATVEKHQRERGASLMTGGMAYGY